MKKVGLALGEMRWYNGEFKALEMAKAAGADTIDFDLEARDYRKAGDKYSLPEDELVEFYSSVRRYAEELGLTIAQTHGRIVGYTLDEEENAAKLKNARKDFLVSKALGAPVCVFHSVSTGRMGLQEPQVMRDLNFRMFSDYLKYANEFGIFLATETFGDCSTYNCCDFFGQADEFYNCFMRLKNEAPHSEWLKVCIDTGHCNTASQFNQPKPADVIRKYKGHIACLHLHDNNGIIDEHKPPRTGNIDWEDVMAALEEAEYDGVYNLEVKWSSLGKNLIEDTAAISVKILRDITETR